jgi:D-alanyl-D-alanine carboxypeptidase
MRTVLLSAAVAATLSMVAVTAGTTVAAGADDARQLQRRLDAITDAGAVGALAEVRDGHLVWRGASGTAVLGAERRVPVNGHVRAGSVTKTLLATVVLQLVEDGEIRLEDTVNTWVPGVVPDGDRITVRNLLNHTSGLFDYLRTLDLPPDPGFVANRWRTWTPTEMVDRAVSYPPAFQPPGSAFSYSNTNYTLLGMIVEKVTGRSYGEEVRRRIIQPLHLSGTSMPGVSPWLPTPHPHGYVPIARSDGTTRLVDLTQMNPSVMGAGGELISTTRDLNRFLGALLDGRLLPDELLREMMVKGVPDGRDYGLGLAWRDTSCGLRVYGNDGDALAYQTYTFATPDGRHRATIALTPDFHGDPDDAVEAFLDEAICG